MVSTIAIDRALGIACTDHIDTKSENKPKHNLLLQRHLQFHKHRQWYAQHHQVAGDIPNTLVDGIMLQRRALRIWWRDRPISIERAAEAEEANLRGHIAYSYVNRKIVDQLDHLGASCYACVEDEQAGFDRIDHVEHCLRYRQLFVLLPFRELQKLVVYLFRHEYDLRAKYPILDVLGCECGKLLRQEQIASAALDNGVQSRDEQ